MKELQVGDKVKITKEIYVINVTTGNSIPVLQGATGKIEAVNHGDVYGAKRYRISFDAIEDKESDGAVLGWVYAEWVAATQHRDSFGHKTYWLPGIEAAKVIADAYRNNEVRRIYIGEDTLNPADPSDTEAVTYWYAITEVKDLPFDNYDSEHLLMMGALGGGRIATAYYEDDWGLFECVKNILNMLVDATDNCRDDYFFIQLIEKDYAGDERKEI